MVLILHLSDLHLAPHGVDESLGDYKRDIIPVVDRARRTSRIRSSLRALGQMLTLQGRRLDAVVISGDVTDRGSPDGFELLDSTLEELGEALPCADQIMVVPGNHDVKWYTAPSSKQRYADFLAGVREKGYRTPLLEGVDILGENELAPDAVDPVLLTSGGTVAILGLNTANYCGVEEATSPAVANALDDLSKRLVNDANWQTLTKDWRKRGSYDLARLGPLQRRWASHFLTRRIDSTLEPVLRIAVMHHQLLPVNTDEEIKPFESLINLGEAREFFAANNIDLLLHGHKHTASVYEDHYATDGAAPLVRTLVVCSARTVGKGQTSGGEVAKLIEIDTSLPTIRRIKIASLPARADGLPLREEDLSPTRSFPLRRDGVGAKIFSGLTMSHVHEQLVDATRDSGAGIPIPLICQVDHGQSAFTVPQTYPDVPGQDQLQPWFDKMVEVWQREDAIPGMQFNHGQRLRQFRRNLNQVDRIIEVLQGWPDSGRALALLLDLDNDQISDNEAQFPAFTLVQFLLVDKAVHAVAYFRKQEMIYWWPINMAELACLQREVVRGLTRHRPQVKTGSIMTVTALPTAGRSVPRVAVPNADRLAADDPTAIVRHAVALVVATPPNRAVTLRWWRALFDDWYPSEEPAPDGDPAPAWGMEEIGHMVRAVAEAFGEEGQTLDGVVQRIEHIAELNKLHVERQRRGYKAEERARWASVVRREIDQIKVDIEARLNID